ncbi:MAG: mechanosensitive ion channel family protein [Desulfurococcales archaeon]|nr:mechanosensitive ion channel family protein [Desulfurococcales archaeon]
MADAEGLARLIPSVVSELLEKAYHDVYRLTEAVVILGVGLLIALLVRNSMRRSLSPRLPAHVYKPLENLVFYSIVFVAAITALRPFGLNLGSLLVAGGLASIVIGLAAQNTLGDVISGVFLLIEQPLRVGDPVQIGDVAGEVVDVRVISTLIRTWDGHLVRIPNKIVFDSIIINFSRTRARRIDFTIGIHYKSDLQDAIKAVRGLIDESPYCLLSPPPEIFVDSYGSSSINLRVRCWTPTRLWYPAKMQIQTEIKRVLEEHGIEIPYPQLDLHLRSAHTDLRVRLEGSRGEGEKVE